MSNAAQVGLPGVRFSAIAADPPWAERGGGKIKRGADRHYPLMRTPDIIHTMLSAPCWRPADNAHLYLWVTNNFLPDGLLVMKALGFRYITMVTWAKDRIGLGQYRRGQTESFLFGVRGRLPAEVKTESTLLGGGLLPRTEHSRKPPEFFESVERASPGPYLEMFSRAPRDGWSVWGNEVEFVEPAPVAKPQGDLFG